MKAIQFDQLNPLDAPNQEMTGMRLARERWERKFNSLFEWEKKEKEEGETGGGGGTAAGYIFYTILNHIKSGGNFNDIRFENSNGDFYLLDGYSWQFENGELVNSFGLEKDDQGDKNKKFKKTQPAYLLLEGVGILATYTISGSAGVRTENRSKFGRTIVTASANGYTAAAQLGKVTFWAYATLYVDGKYYDKKYFNIPYSPDGYYYDPNNPPIGNVEFILIPTNKEIKLIITGGYIFEGDEGRGSPIPGRTNITLIF